MDNLEPLRTDEAPVIHAPLSRSTAVHPVPSRRAPNRFGIPSPTAGHIVAMLGGAVAVPAALSFWQGPTIGAGLLLAVGTGGVVTGSLRVWRAFQGLQRFWRDLEPILSGVADGQGDLTRRLPIRRNDLAPVSRQFNDFLDRLNRLVWLSDTAGRTLNDSAHRLSNSSVHMVQTAGHIESAISQAAADSSLQADSITAGGMTAMAATSQQVAAANQEIAAAAEEQTTNADHLAGVVDVVASLAKDLSQMTDGYRTASAIWGDKFVTEIGFVDEQHQQLFEAINRFGDAVRAGQGFDEMGRTLAFLLAYTEEHFADEEALMRRHGYPDLAAHQAMHASFASRIRALHGEVQRGDLRSVFNASRLLSDWLSNHIEHVDIKGYVPFVQAAGQSGGGRGR